MSRRAFLLLLPLLLAAAGLGRPRAPRNTVIRLGPNNAAALRNRGFLHTRQRQYDRAIADFDEAIRLDATAASAFTGRAYLHRAI